MQIVAPTPKKNTDSKAKLAKKNIYIYIYSAQQFYTIYEQKFQILLFPNDFENLKSLDIGFWEVGAKRRLNGVKRGRTNPYNFFLPR